MSTSTFTTTTEQLGENRVKLRVEVPEALLAGALAAAYRRWASEIKVPGFRKGKVPRQVIDARVGREAVRDDALREALPDLYEEVLKSEDLVAIAAPEIEVVDFTEGSPLVFEATVDLRPEIVLPDLPSLKVEAPPSDVTDDDVDEQLERLRERFAELETATREARRGDYVLIDLNGHRHGEPVEGASSPDYLYELGSHTGPPKLDDELEGNRAGAILKFNDTLPGGALGEEISFTVLLKEVKAKKLPALDDEFAKTVGEFGTLDELKEDLRTRLVDVKAAMVEQEIRSRALAALVEASALVSPEKLVDQEFEHRLGHFEDDLRRAGMNVDDYGRQVQLTELEIRRDIREEAARSVKAELLLEEVARRAEIGVTQEDLGGEVAYLAARSGRDPKELAEELTTGGRLGALAADIMRRKALEHVVATMEVSGRPAPRQEGTDAAATGGDAGASGKEEPASTVDGGNDAAP